METKEMVKEINKYVGPGQYEKLGRGWPRGTYGYIQAGSGVVMNVCNRTAIKKQYDWFTAEQYR